MAQDKLAKKFPGSEHITDTNSTHYIHAYNPQLVSDSIRQVVEAERDGEKTVGDVKGADKRNAPRGSAPRASLPSYPPERVEGGS